MVKIPSCRRIVLFTHPEFLDSQSMPRFARMLAEGMRDRGYLVDIWTAQPRFCKLLAGGPMKKWLGYIDQFIVFPLEAKKRMRQLPEDVLYVFTDHALGPWVPLAANRKHVVHCHDFLAQRAALGQIPETQIGLTGQKYQAFIRRGYRRGKNFISVSEKTRADLHEFLGFDPPLSMTIYNGLNRHFHPSSDGQTERAALSRELRLPLENGYLLHVGGNLWYKNRKGVVEIYNAWKKKETGNELPLLLVGESPDEDLKRTIQQSDYKPSIFPLAALPDDVVRRLYAAASVFLFPSFAEGFGWPIAEAMASGVPVITTGEAPMTEVGGDAAFYIPHRPNQEPLDGKWARDAAATLSEALSLPPGDRNRVIEKGLENVKRFNGRDTLDHIAQLYRQILA